LAANQRAATTLITRNSLLSWIEIQIRHRYTWPIDQIVIWLEIIEALLISMDWERVEKVTRGTWRADLLRCTHHLLYGLGTILDTVLPEGVVAPLLIGAKILQRISSLTWRTLSIFDSLHQSSKILRQLEVTIFSPSDPKKGSEDPVHSLLGGWTEITQRLWLALMTIPEGSPKNSELFDFLTARIVFQKTNGLLSEKSTPEMDALIRPFTSLSDLLSSPSVLSSESSLLTSELTSLCHASHSTFLLLHNTSQTLSTSFDSLSSSIDSLISTIPSLNVATQNFTETSKPILEERRKAALILEQQEKLVDLLEIPALIDTCARNGQYQDAFELSMHASQLWQQFQTSNSNSQSLGIIKSLESEVEGSVRLMLGGLINALKGKAKLPILYDSVRFLRRMGNWSEEELAIMFLCCRSALLEELHNANEGIYASALINHSSSTDGENPDVAKYLKGYIDIFREGVHGVVTAYTTIFLDQAMTSPQAELERIDELRYFLSIFTNQQVKALTSKLGTYLPTIQDFTSLSSLLTQLNHCATSFARIGLDFRPMIAPLFEGAVLTNVRRAMTRATETFVDLLLEGERSSSPPSTWLIAASGVPGSQPSIPTIPDVLETEAHGKVHLPPPAVLSFSPPLANLLNAHLTVFNSLRLLPIISLLPSLHELLCQSLATTTRAILDYVRVTSHPSSPTSRMSFDRQRNSVSSERRNSQMIMSPTGRASGSAMDSSGRPASPSLQRSSTPTSARPFSPNPRQSFISGEDAKAKQQVERTLVLTVGKAHARLLVPFLLKGLVEGVYGGLDVSKSSEHAQALDAAVAEWEKWYEDWKPKNVNGYET
ncbi:Dor1-domain-containing protein, partial [Serendipita vermifera]